MNKNPPLARANRSPPPTSTAGTVSKVSEP